jgi:predicted transcriptional regulator
MSAVPANVVDFKLPKRKPKVIEKEAMPDRRSLAVVPIRAAVDKTLTDACFRTLAVLCSYCNRAGITWVSQKRLAEDMKVSRQAITKQITKLRAAGYVEITRKGWRGERSNTLRVVFDTTLTAQDAIAITSGIEDTRPPDQAKREEELRNIMADNDLPDLSPEQIQANMRRLKTLLGTLGSPTQFRTHEPQSMETLMATTKPIAKRKPRSAQPKVALTQVGTDVLKGDREQTHRQPDAVANEDTIHRQPNTVAYEEGLHRQPDRQPNGVAKNTKNIGLIEVYKMYELNKKNVVITELDMKWSALVVEVGTSASDLVAAIQSTDSLAEACKLVLEAKGL